MPTIPRVSLAGSAAIPVSVVPTARRNGHTFSRRKQRPGGVRPSSPPVAGTKTIAGRAYLPTARPRTLFQVNRASGAVSTAGAVQTRRTSAARSCTRFGRPPGRRVRRLAPAVASRARAWS
ncbi:hypothetical protein AB0E08_35080 [Streptomyces sp. NPDC048281]|uniref:hypothetical protein n=1 Tax=Streptomyces sp. NPDC048281 TaxID=3154715 RepID=UPI003429D353